VQHAFAPDIEQRAFAPDIDKLTPSISNHFYGSSQEAISTMTMTTKTWTELPQTSSDTHSCQEFSPEDQYVN